MALGIGEAVELVKTVSELIKRGATIELQEKVMDLRQAVLNAKEELLELRDRNQQLTEQLAQRQKFKFDGKVYWLEGEEGPARGPFCPRCFDRDAKRVHLHPGAADDWPYRCRTCSGGFGV